RQLHAFAQHHEKNEKKDAGARGRTGPLRVIFDFSLDLFAQVPRNAVHPDDHRNNEDGGHEKQQALEAVAVDAPVVEGDRDGKAPGRGRTDAPPDITPKPGPPGAGQIDQDDANNQSRFNAFAESNEKSRKHADSSQNPSCNSFATTTLSLPPEFRQVNRTNLVLFLSG